ncbi:MAG: glycosyltransferase [Bacteroidales bacterium]
MVCPLNWGLGHAARCIPIIHKLQLAGFEVIVAADGRALALLEEECSDIKSITLPGFSPDFPSGRNLILKIPGWLCSLSWHTFKEHQDISLLVDEHNIDVVISDNRFGLFTKKAKCVFITHQVMFKTPLPLKFSEPFLYRINRFFINKFDVCWIPDLPGSDNLSGDLSHKYPLPENARFIGLLSRFQREKVAEEIADKSVLALLSGPEPQRTIFEGLIIGQLKKTSIPATIVRGTPSELNSKEPVNNVSLYNHLLTGELAGNIRKAGFVICRSGYSTLMDMAVLGKKAVLLVPTPGQTEQEYLAKRLHKLGWMNYQDQNNFNIDKPANEVGEYCGINLPTDETLLDMQIEALRISLNHGSASR